MAWEGEMTRTAMAGSHQSTQKTQQYYRQYLAIPDHGTLRRRCVMRQAAGVAAKQRWAKRATTATAPDGDAIDRNGDGTMRNGDGEMQNSDGEAWEDDGDSARDWMARTLTWAPGPDILCCLEAGSVS